jgi:hypothetical protein
MTFLLRTDTGPMPSKAFRGRFAARSEAVSRR